MFQFKMIEMHLKVYRNHFQFNVPPLDMIHDEFGEK